MSFRLSNLVRFIEDKAAAAAPRIGHAVKNAAHSAKIEISARAAVVKVLMVEQAQERSIKRAENDARRNARRLVETMEVANRALEILNKRELAEFENQIRSVHPRGEK